MPKTVENQGRIGCLSSQGTIFMFFFKKAWNPVFFMLWYLLDSYTHFEVNRNFQNRQNVTVEGETETAWGNEAKASVTHQDDQKRGKEHVESV